MYPDIVLRIAGSTALTALRDPPFPLLFNSLLWLIFAMNWIWYSFIIQAIVRISSEGQASLRDERDLSASSRSPRDSSGRPRHRSRRE
jgi:hypothetical protein